MRLTIVVPCFNEADRWDPAYWQVLSEAVDARWLFVDDGSTDGTQQLLREASVNLNAQVEVLARNGGKAEAVRAGMLRACADADVVGYLDADGAFPIGAVQQVVDSMASRWGDPKTDAVWSSRVALAGRSIQRRTSRHYLGRAVITLASLNRSGVPYDTQSGFKLFRVTPRLGEVLAAPFTTRWLFEFELLDRWAAAHGAPMSLWEEPVCAWRDVSGSHLRGAQIPRILQEIALTCLRPYRKGGA